MDIVLGVFGLDNRRITKRGLADPPATALLTMPTITKLYDFPPNLAAGQTIAVFSEAGYLPSPSYSPNQPATNALCIRNQYAHTPPPTGFIVF